VARRVMHVRHQRNSLLIAGCAHVGVSVRGGCVITRRLAVALGTNSRSPERASVERFAGKVHRPVPRRTVTRTNS
jgi:hypothetical protein